MDKKHYDYFWGEIISPEINSILEKGEGKLFLNSTIEELKKNIWNEYHAENKKVHEFMRDPNERIDRHKIAALFAYVILKLYPIGKTIGSKEEVPHITRLANETFALNVSLNIIHSFLIHASKNNPQLAEIFKNGFIPPKTINYGNYWTTVLRALSHAKIKANIDMEYGFHFDLFIFSNLLFMLEAYTIKCHNN